MKHALLACALIASAGISHALDTDKQASSNFLPKAYDAVDTFHKTLGGKLKAAMGEGGPVNAIDVCHKEAQKVAADLSQQFGLSIRRTTERVRNPNDAPDATDLATLKDFEQMLLAKQSPLEKHIVLEDGSERYYRGIVIQPQCLACHGDNVSPEVKAVLDHHYPNDQATGYKEGQLRGTFVVER